MPPTSGPGLVVSWLSRPGVAEMPRSTDPGPAGDISSFEFGLYFAPRCLAPSVPSGSRNDPSISFYTSFLGGDNIGEEGEVSLVVILLWAAATPGERGQPGGAGLPRN